MRNEDKTWEVICIISCAIAIIFALGRMSIALEGDPNAPSGPNFGYATVQVLDKHDTLYDDESHSYSIETNMTQQRYVPVSREPSTYDENMGWWVVGKTIPAHKETIEAPFSVASFDNKETEMYNSIKIGEVYIFKYTTTPINLDHYDWGKYYTVWEVSGGSIDYLTISVILTTIVAGGLVAYYILIKRKKLHKF
jgi:hypothetical protein